MDKLLILVVLGLEVEAVWETLKMVWQSGKLNFDKIGALMTGLLIAFGAGLGLNELVGVQLQIPYLDTILTGILISRGSNFIHELIEKMDKKQP